MGADPVQPGPVTRAIDDRGNSGRGQALPRCQQPKENRPAHRDRPALPQVVGQSLADIVGKRHSFGAAALAVHHDLAGPPVDVIKSHAGHLAGAQTQSDQH